MAEPEQKRSKTAMAPGTAGERWITEGEQWCAWDPNPHTRGEVAALVTARDTTALQSLLGQRMVFGTSGLRASMGAGVVSMNDLTVLQISQAMCAYVLAE